MTNRPYIPGRKDLIWMDFEPARGREIGKSRPAIVLSDKEYNQRTGLLICCPISTQIRGATTEVPVAALDRPCVIVASMVVTLSWRERKTAKIATASTHTFDQTLLRLLPLIGAESVLSDG
ncbi:MAG: type II toxin-antitoxin system PemK/MazF family toxin [Gammaproteobacteria bacterium]|nr:type II toxin-antitoxin system PemK/MazF family toxin [Gammaproteobacteria bacterium]MXW47019.1 MazF family transcriptional regulator [Gammaproteobacteria bacterium]MYD02910.1 MazF family transcriptional regulator [Gammaproteobacteria bacterium]MYI24487.1 MazF family transcriptional regulator [Gammaproteobacteria bacterium]